MAPALWICLLIWSAVLKVISAGEQCFIWEEFKYKYCEWGCCGGEFDTYCCFPIGLIIGAFVGSLFIIVVVISVVCCCVKKKGRAGQVIGTASTTPVQAVGQQLVGHQAYPTMPVQQMSPGGPPYAPIPGTMPPPYPTQPSPGPPGPGLYNDPTYPQGNPPPYK